MLRRNRFAILLISISLLILAYHFLTTFPKSVLRSSTKPGTAMIASDEPHINHLIVVCCHAIYIGSPSPKPAQNDKGYDESEWLTESFQAGEVPTFIEHIRTGVKELAADPRAILVFSGGATKPTRTKVSEGAGYYNYALSQNLFGYNPSIQDRMFFENFATDSFQNVLLSLIQYPVLLNRIGAQLDTGAISFPYKLTIISHDFKKSRFYDLHLPAIGWPITDPQRLNYIGVNPPFSKQKMDEIIEGDLKRGYGAWKDDLYGTGELLSQKRTARGWSSERFRKEIFGNRLWISQNEMVQQALSGLLVWNGGDGGNHIFPTRLPWS